MSKGRYGVHGGQYAAETLMNELIHLEEQYEYYKNNPEFQQELAELLREYAGRPSLLYLTFFIFLAKSVYFCKIM